MRGNHALAHPALPAYHSLMTDAPIKDASATHWVYKLPQPVRAFAQLSRLDRPVGYWLLTLPGWIGLAFASLSHGFAGSDLKWAVLILIGAIAMRGAGCTYNDIVDQDLDAKVERTALRPLPAGSVTTKQAWIWLFAQCAVGLIVLLCLPRLAQIISLCSIPLVAGYPFMKRITWWPQVWLGLTFNWAVLVAYAAKTGTWVPALLIYAGMVFWTIGYDTIYACQDIEDDAIIGVKSTARKFGNKIKPIVAVCYFIFSVCLYVAFFLEPFGNVSVVEFLFMEQENLRYMYPFSIFLILLPALIFMISIVRRFDPSDTQLCLKLFKSNFWVALLIIIGLCGWPSVFGVLALSLP